MSNRNSNNGRQPERETKERKSPLYERKGTQQRRGDSYSHNKPTVSPKERDDILKMIIEPDSSPDKKK